MKWNKWKSRNLYVTLVVLLLLYGIYDADSAIKLIEALIKAFEILISGD